MTIRVLPSSLVNQIAAGEVIERPASALKELIENAIDAGATQIDIMVRDGGKSLLQVADNGKGMTEKELALAVHRHATSKLPDDDLFHLSFLGFRGEALPSIGSVARLSITSRPENASSAFEIKIEGGSVGETAPAAAGVGTTVAVRDLFYKVPARLKFLKSDTSEMMAMVDVVERFALCYPAIGFSLRDGERSKLNFPPVHDSAARMNAVMRKDFSENTLPFSFDRETVKLSGRTSRPTYTARNSLGMFLFVNNRPVKDRQIFGAVKAAYDGFMPHNVYPYIVLFIDIDPSLVDVNVHPAKAEVRFKDPGYIRSLIIQSIRATLSTSEVKVSTTLSSDLTRTLERNVSNSFQFPSSSASVSRPSGFSDQRPAMSWDAPFTKEEEPEKLSVEDEKPLGEAIAQIGLTYILSRTKDGLILVDQHAAHERLIYERIQSALQKKDLARQMLLLPEVIELSMKEAAALFPLTAELADFGFAIEPFGETAVMVREVPAFLGAFDIARMIKDLAEVVRENDIKAELAKHMKNVCAVMACHSSIRKGRPMTVYEMNALLRDMEKTPTAAQCIHGRPTYIPLSLTDLDRLFKR